MKHVSNAPNEPHLGAFGLLLRRLPFLGRASTGRTGQRAKRRRIAIVAVVIGLFAALIELPMPLEDGFKAARAELRTREAPGDIVVVAIDDATLNALATDRPTRRQDAQLVDRIFAQGASRLVFDRAYADPAPPEDDAAFAAELRQHRGQVWLGASPAADNGLQQHAGLLPTPALRDSVAVASMMGQSGPFGLSVRFPTSTPIGADEIPSISAILGEYRGEEGWYRPDLAIDARSIPTVSYAEILSGAGDVDLKGKTVVVAPTHLGSTDFHNLPLGGKIPGVYFHVMGAHTLQDGMPLDLSWYPAMLFAAMVLFAQARRRRPLRAVTWGAIGVLPIAATLLDASRISIDVFPALIALGVGMVRLNLHAGKIYNKSTNLVLREALETTGDDAKTDVYAFKITNLGDLTGTGVSKDLGRFVERVIDTLQGAAQSRVGDRQIVFEKDTLIWQATKLDARDLHKNAEGLIALLRSGTAVQGGARIEGTIGIETNRTLPLETRIHNAIQAAELGSRKRIRSVIADTKWLDLRERRIELLSELDKAMEERSIGIGYQPKVDLLSGRVVGAEALIRWEHPELGYIEPTEAVAVAEEHDRIDELTAYVVDRALEDAGAAIALDPMFKLAVNVSAQTLGSVMVLYHVARLRSRHRFPGKNLIIEVTESTPLDDIAVREIIRGLQKDDITFSIDDFGTGHSTLAYLGQVPSAELKIDRRFIMNLATSEDSLAVVKGTIEMAHTLGKVVVAEGIEDDLTAERLRRLGCDIGQGFLFSPAVAMDELLLMLEEEYSVACA
jgi:EAL domain-containing protein (putative c-di-GMP-specific phosphodiesterase class I)/CHASE2 domain-containing sensor protein